LRNQTRLGGESVTAIAVWVDADGQWRVQPDSTAFSPDKPVSDELARQLYTRQLRISRQGLLKHLQAQAPHPALAEHPLLAHFQPLLLQDGVCQIGKLIVRLDPKLGLVYSTQTPQELP
jgi:CRISPR-associated endonuclease/helicase Cas3